MRRSLAKLYVPQLRASGVYIKTAKSFLSLCPFKSFEKEVIKTGEYFKDTYSDDRAAYYQGPWQIKKSGVSVAKGNLVAFNKTEIVPELVRQVQFFLTMQFNYFMYD